MPSSLTGQERFTRIKRILLWILLFNWGVSAAKIIYGLLTHFESMVADGLHSLSDGVSNIVGIVGITLAAQPADKEHPYGHKKYETLFSLAITALLLILSFSLLTEGISHLFTPSRSRIDLFTLLIMLCTMGINIFVTRYELRYGREFKSDILIADALHTRADIFTSLSVIIAAIMIPLGFPIIDPIATIIISLFIGRAAINIFRQGAEILVDSAAIDNKKIKNVVLSVAGVISCHKIRTRGRKDDIYVDLHVQVQPSMSIAEAHQISYKIEEAMKQGIPGVSDVVVHLEPK